MRRIAYFILICISCLAYFGVHTTVYAEDSYPDTVKVGLFYGSSAKDSVVVRSDSGFQLGYESDGEFICDNAIEETEIIVTVGEGNTIMVSSYNYNAEQFPTLYPTDGNIFIDGVEYRGGVQFKRISSDKLTVINIVEIEKYLYSVIGKEMSPSWNIEALKAQAVCARGFVFSNYEKFAKYGFNVDNTTSSQVYKGVSTETESTRRAADETNGLVLKHDGKIIQSIYCASMGGASANAENVWGGSYPYLTSVVDPYENPNEATRYSWEITLTSDEIKDCLANSGTNIGDITNVEIVDSDEAGYVLELMFTGTNGTHTVKKSNCRGIFGGKIHSQRYTVSGGSGEESSEPINIISAKGITQKSASQLFILDWGKNASFTVLSSSGTRTIAPSKPASSDKFVFNGNGWGHGVGMSQWGAKAMADQGFVFEDILTFYYTGTYLENIY